MILPIIQFYENSCIIKLFTAHFDNLYYIPSITYKEKDYWNANEAFDAFKSYLLDYLK